MDFKKTFQAYQDKVENALEALVPPHDTRPAVLHEAMRYSLQAGGKRLRPILVLSSHALFPSQIDPLPAAVAVECLHTYSLIHDDLPCMDDSDLRRGSPTCHKQFGEANALLAGDALLTHAFWLLAKHYRATPEIAVDLVEMLSDAAGSQKLIGGQVEDLLGEQSTPTPEKLAFIHQNKTAALLSASLCMGLRMSETGPEHVPTMQRVGHHLGLAFQIVDDILDSTANEAVLGKPTGADIENNKMTYPALFGLDRSRQEAAEHTAKALEYCQQIGGNHQFLLALIENMSQRIH